METGYVLLKSRFADKSYFQGFLIIASSLVLPYAVVDYHNILDTHRQDWLFPFGVYYHDFGEYLGLGRFSIRFSPVYPFSFLSMIAVIWIAIGLILAAEVMILRRSKELTKTAFAITTLLLTLQLIVPLVVIPLVYSEIGSRVAYIIPLPIPVPVGILLLGRKGIRFMLESYYQGFLIIVSSLLLRRKGIKFTRESYHQGFLIIASSLVFPCAVIGIRTAIGNDLQAWIFPFGVYFHDFGQWLGLGSFLLLFESGYPFNFSSIVVVIWVAIGLILATEVMTSLESKEFTKKAFSITILLLTLQIAVPIIVILLLMSPFTLGGVRYVIPLPIPFIVAILILKRKGISFMHETYYQSFLIVVLNLMLPYAVVGHYTGLETHIQDWLFPFGVYYHSFGYLRLGPFYMRFSPAYPFSFFSMIAVIWVAIGLILATEVMTLQGSKELTKMAFSITIVLLALQLIVPLAVIPLVYSEIGNSVAYVIPLPISVLVAILLLRRSGVTLRPAKNLGGS